MTQQNFKIMMGEHTCIVQNAR